ncbi:MAG: 5-(carboxyamino)imidazole ribonucleotide mutase, partial [Bacilli bacterium]|nr:5-(carboxyamino)imidazole ribonucleotide mutase [Bacilli bacterium]
MKLVSIIMGSINDKDIMSKAFAVFEEFAIPYEKKVISAHRALDELLDYTKTARERGVKVFIAGAGGAA